MKPAKIGMFCCCVQKLPIDLVALKHSTILDTKNIDTNTNCTLIFPPVCHQITHQQLTHESVTSYKVVYARME